MENQKLLKKIANLESQNDQLISELQYIDNLAKKVGFLDGIKTLKSAAEELLEEEQMYLDDENPPNVG